MTTPFNYTTRYTLDKTHFSETYDESVPKHQGWRPYSKAIAFGFFGWLLVGFGGELSFVGWFMMTLAIIEALGTRFHRAWWLARQMMSRAANSQLTLTITDEGITTESAAVKSEILWQNVTDIAPTEQGWLIYQGKHKAYVSNRSLDDAARAFLAQKQQAL